MVDRHGFPLIQKPFRTCDVISKMHDVLHEWQRA
jgi:hypothetical protein